MLFPKHITDTVRSAAYWADRSIRAELAAGLIASENDYTSNLTGMLRRQINAKAVPGLCATSVVLQQGYEHELGADACIILSNGQQFKVCMFEAKWPRLSTHKDYWDYRQRSNNVSHFHDQLDRQAIAALAGFVAWEMFYCEYRFGAQPKFMPNALSACAMHHDALAASTARVDPNAPWTDLDLESLLDAHLTRIDQILTQVCRCLVGEAYSGDFSTTDPQHRYPAKIPVIKYDPAAAGSLADAT